MAGTQRGSPDDGRSVKITLSSGVPVGCRIYHGSITGLPRCLKCGYFLEYAYFLNCRHTLCEQCFYAHTEYVCKVDKTRTVTKPGVSRPAVLTLALSKNILECPECHETHAYGNIKDHLEVMHPASFKREQRSTPKQQQERNEQNRHRDETAGADETATLKSKRQHKIASDEQCRKPTELLQEEIALLKEENGNLQTTVRDLRATVQTLQTTVQKLQSSEEKNVKAVAKLQDELQSASMHRLKLEEIMQKQQSEFQDLQATVQKLQSSEEKNVKAMAKLQDELQSASTHRLKLEEIMQKQRRDFQEADNGVQKLKAELRMNRLLPVFEHVWKLQPYSALRKNLLFNNAMLSTGVLSVNTPGYKIELMVSIKGDYREWQRQRLKDESSCKVPVPHLAAMFRIHQGEDDDLLAWPFMNKISLRLLNHLDEDKSILLELDAGDGDGDWLKKPKRGAVNPMFGFSRVITLPDLENVEEGFLYQDCIVLTLTVHRRE